MKSILLTGAFGFIGSHMISHIVSNYPEYELHLLDNLSEPHSIINRNKIKKLNRYNIDYFICDFTDYDAMLFVFGIVNPNIVIHMGAKSNVDCSIASAVPFIETNVKGTQILCDLSIQYGVERFHYVSTDEVYGELTSDAPPWTENSPINPRNPYACSKASGEYVVRAAHYTHGLQYSITRSCNNFGTGQADRNLIPTIIRCLKNDVEIPIHGTGENIREWIHADDHCSAIMRAIENKPNETYNVGSGIEKSNLEMIDIIAGMMGKTPKTKTGCHRPGQDWRYSVDCSKMKALGWQPQKSLDGIHAIIKEIK